MNDTTETLAGSADRKDWVNWTTSQQGLASDPARFSWVSANAGSGKTHVLTQRVIRLLLSGARPSSILCLTYTKAAAAEMSNRVFARLSQWATMPEADLRQTLLDLEGKSPGPNRLAEARRLFAKALETPGGLKIQTIHAFCEALLHQFPLEANVAGHFAVLDDRAAAVLLADARRSLLTATTTEEDTGLAQAFGLVLDIGDEHGLDQLLGEIVASRSAIMRFLVKAEASGGLEAKLRQAMGISPDATEAGIAGQFFPLPGFEGRELGRYIDLAEQKGSATVQETAYGLKQAVKETDAMKRAELLEQVFLKKDGQPYADRSFIAKAMLPSDPQLPEKIVLARLHIAECRDRLRIMRLFDVTHAALTLAARLLNDYEELKKRRGQLDFEDLIARAADLLTKSDVGPWVHYKLDQGIDHVLVDEAQDTSPVQWSVVKSLTDDFTSGKSARDLVRTLFAVGDEKQSIYSFQGARPERFYEEGMRTRQQAEAAGMAFSGIRLPLSFRSTDDVLSAVDQVFSVPENARGLSANLEPVIHRSNRQTEPGSVDVWDIIAPAAAEDSDDWTAPFDATPESAPASRLANRIAATLSDWIGKETIIERGKARLIEPGDILVLVRKRDSFVGALTRALKRRSGIPVAGADRLVLTGHIAIQDLMALGRFVLLPADDLSLASLFKSPLFDLSETDIFTVATGRQERESLWHCLCRMAAEGHAPFSRTVEKLQALVAVGQTLGVHDFYARLLGVMGARAQFLARLGSEASDILDEFLSFALDHETKGLPGLQSFISTLELEAPTVKREQDKGRNEVRIMTVHAAKGLEAPVVFLVDGCGKAFTHNHMARIRMTGEGVTAFPVWSPSRALENSLTLADAARVKELAEDEYRRLLYVAMTRAADRLIVCGHRGKRENKDCWHQMIVSALRLVPDHCQPRSFSAGGEQWEGFSWSTGTATLRAVGAIKPEKPVAPVTLPVQLHRPLPGQAHLPRPLVPSGAGAFIDDEDGDLIVGSRLFGERPQINRAAQRGRIIHRFLQVLPDTPESGRRQAAERYLERSCPWWPQGERDALIRSVFAILEDPAMRPVFASGSRAEVNIMGTLPVGGRTFAISGRIDRLSVSNETIMITDFKTNRQPPESPEDIPLSHKAQLALYQAILQPLYPGQNIACALIYTANASLFVLPQTLLRESLAALTTK